MYLSLAIASPESELVASLYDDVEDVKCNKKMVQDTIGGKFRVTTFKNSKTLILCKIIILGFLETT